MISQYRRAWNDTANSTNLVSEVNGAVYGVTKFSDLSEAEFAEQFLLHRHDLHFNNSRLSDTYRIQRQSSDIPKTYDL